jgi:signal peptidase I
VGEAYEVVGPSMMPTLNGGDRLYVDKLAYGLRVPFARRSSRARPPRRGDVVVFSNDARAGTNRGADGGELPPTFVKRVIGLPGDVIGYREGTPTINGWTVPSCDAGPIVTSLGDRVLRGRLKVEVLDGRAYLTLYMPFDEPRGLFTVPPDEVYVLGDDRGVSLDSRRLDRGRSAGVPIAAVKGRVSRIVLGATAGGALDFAHPVRALALSVRQPELDLASIERRIAGCVAHMPPVSSPPPPTALATGP